MLRTILNDVTMWTYAALFIFPLVTIVINGLKQTNWDISIPLIVLTEISAAVIAYLFGPESDFFWIAPLIIGLVFFAIHVLSILLAKYLRGKQ